MSEKHIFGQGSPQSPSEVFNTLLSEIAKQNAASTVFLSGADDLEPEVYQGVEDFIGASTTLFEKIRSNSDRQTIGVVYSVRDDHVTYIDQAGDEIIFRYSTNEDIFKQAPDGFKIGDIILSRLQGMAMKSVRPINLRPELRLSIIRKVRQSFEQRRIDLSKK